MAAEDLCLKGDRGEDRTERALTERREKTMRIIISGVSSFLGIQSARYLLSRGHEVTGLVRKSSKNLEKLNCLDGLSGLQLQYLDFDRLPEPGMIPAFPEARYDVFLHYSWDGVGSLGRADSALQERNIENAKKAYLLAEALHCRKFLFAGSQAEYGNGDQKEPKPVSPYGKAKLAFSLWAEKRSREKSQRQEEGILRESLPARRYPGEATGGQRTEEKQAEEAAGEKSIAMQFLHLRIFSVYGEGEHENNLLRSLLLHIREGAELTLSPCTQDWNYMEVRDYVRALGLLIEREEAGSGDYDIASVRKQGVPLHSPAGDSAEEAGRGSAHPSLRAYVEEAAEIFRAHFHQTKKLSELLHFGVRSSNVEGDADLHPDSSRLEALGYRDVISFSEGIKAMAERSCLLCGGETELLSRFPDMPESAQKIPAESELSADAPITLPLCQCRKCGLVQLRVRPVSYYKDVIRAGGGTKTMISLRKEEYERLLSRMDEAEEQKRKEAGDEAEKKYRILEAGCGRGEFLAMWGELSKEKRERVELSGIEHKRELVQEARAQGLSVTEGFAEGDILFPGAPFDAFVQFNFLEHQPKPTEMLRTIYRNLKAGAFGLVTVPSLGYIEEEESYYELIRDHLAYYSEESLRYLFTHSGFRVLSLRTVNRDTIEILVRKPEESEPLSLASVRTASAKFRWLNCVGIRRNEKILKDKIRSYVESLRREKRSLAVWGAGHQGFTFLSSTALRGYVRYVIDSAPFKQGRFCPASHIPIVAPAHFHEEPVDEILIAAPGYTREIGGMIREKFGGEVRTLALVGEGFVEIEDRKAAAAEIQGDIDALVLEGRGKIRYIKKAYPRLRDSHGVLLRPLLVSPCTSDVHTIWQGSPKRKNLTLGHECLCRIETAGEEVRDFQAGEVVAVPAITPNWADPEAERNYAHAGCHFSAHLLGKSIDGAFQEIFYLPYADRNLAHIPEGMAYEDALMCVDVLATARTACLEAEIAAGQSVVVMGIGAIGLSAILCAREMGAGHIFAVGSRPENVLLAESMSTPDCTVEVLNYRTLRAELPEGMHPLSNSTGSPVVNFVLQETGTAGADAVLICGGSETALPQAVDMVKYGTGIVSSVMYYGADTELQEQQEAHTAIDGLMIPKFSIGRGMAGKTLKFSLSRGGRAFLEETLRFSEEHHLHPGIFITKSYEGLDKIEASIYDMKNRAVIKAAVKLGKF